MFGEQTFAQFRTGFMEQLLRQNTSDETASGRELLNPVHVPSTISETLRQCDRESYPSLHQLLKLSCTLPVPTAEYERTISHLQTLKSYQISNRMRPRVLVQNQHTRELICARNTNKYNNKEEDVPLVEFMYLVFTRMPGESYRRRLRSLFLYLCYVF